MGKLLKKNWFLIGLVAVVALALGVPQLGKTLDPRKLTSMAAIVLIFFLSGLSLPTEEMVKGLRHWRVHVYVQLFIFVFTPLLFWLTSWPLRGLWGEGIQIGILALAVFPTTISSCIVLTQMAAGNVAATIFNAVLSNLAGIIISPLLLTLLLRESGATLPAEEVVRILGKIATRVLLPFVLGQVVRRLAERHVCERRKLLSRISGVLILLVVLFALSRSADDPRLRALAPRFPAALAYLAAMQLVIIGLAWTGARLLRLKRDERVTVLFTAPQKTLAMGVPLLSAYFASRPDLLGVALLPLLFYHPWQIFIAGLLLHTPLVTRDADG